MEIRRLITSPYFATESKLLNLSGPQLTCNHEQVWSLVSLDKRSKVLFYWAVPMEKKILLLSPTSQVF